MAEVRTYVYQGREITVTEAAKLAGVTGQTIYNRLEKNGGDIELAILGGVNKPMKLPDIEPTPKDKLSNMQPEAEKKVLPTILTAAQATDNLIKILGCECTGSDVRMESLRRLNGAIDALRNLRDDDMAEDVMITKVRELILKLDAMRGWMYSDLIDWHAIAENGGTHA